MTNCVMTRNQLWRLARGIDSQTRVCAARTLIVKAEETRADAQRFSLGLDPALQVRPRIARFVQTLRRVNTDHEARVRAQRLPPDLLGKRELFAFGEAREDADR